MNESELYESVRKFIRKRYNCFYDTIEAGKEGIGSVDIFGVFHKDLEKTEIETVCVEVKIKKIPLAVKLGQAKGYTLFCRRVYFASLNDFNGEDIEIAKYLGIGLISIKNEDSIFVCNEILEPKINMPIQKLANLVLTRRKILACKSCGVIERRNYTETIYDLDKIYNYTKTSIKEGKDLLIKNKSKQEFYCNGCAKIKLGLE